MVGIAAAPSRASGRNACVVSISSSDPTNQAQPERTPIIARAAQSALWFDCSMSTTAGQASAELRTDSGIPLEQVYRPGDVTGLDYERDLGDPGTFPYTRGQRGGGATEGWIQRELSGEGSPARSNDQFHKLIAHGALGLDVIGDTPTEALIDPDHRMARPAVGAAGVSICRRLDFVELYQG